MEFVAKPFDELTLSQLYEILRSRSQIFMLEQNILCQDMDRVDYDSYHLFLENEGEVIAYLRAFYLKSEPDTVCIGRVLSLHHRQGLGSELMKQSLDFIFFCMHQENIFSFFFIECNNLYLHIP